MGEGILLEVGGYGVWVWRCGVQRGGVGMIGADWVAFFQEVWERRGWRRKRRWRRRRRVS